MDIQTISWPEIVRRIGAIREDNPNTALSSQNAGTPHDVTVAKLDAHDIANRILRQENYLIALFNKDLLDLRVPLPQILSRFISEEEGKGKMLTQALEWNLRFCLMEYLFDRNGQVRKVFLNSRNRVPLIEGCVVPPPSLLLCSARSSVHHSVQIAAQIHIHGNSECHLCAVHRAVSSHVFLLPLFRGTISSPVA